MKSINLVSVFALNIGSNYCFLLLLLFLSAQVQLVLESVEVAAVTTQAVDRWLPLAEESGVQRVLDCTSAAKARVVRGGLEQMLDNLLDNAIGVAPPDTSIHVSVANASGQIEVSVQDEGPGLTVQEQSRATSRFWRAPGAEPGGSGLGLSIVAELAAASGGSLKHSDPADHQGLVVTIGLLVATR